MNEKLTKLLWIDLEMTGLNPIEDEILEVAAIITEGPDFQIIAEMEYAIKYSGSAEEKMQQAKMFEWKNGKQIDTGKTVFDLHNDNGLMARIAESGVSLKGAETKLADFINANFGEEKAVLAGNSIHQDRRFIRSKWGQVENLLHYRMLDVTSFKLALILSGHDEFEKGESHRAMDDIKDSIEELKYWLELAKG